jgi:mannose-6-phosphate isomerase
VPNLYPLLLRPEFHERIWGTHDLSPFYPPQNGPNPIGEVWLTGEGCRIANGEFAGRTLGEVALELGATLNGTLAPQPRFPLLVKIIFPNDKLSVQVHPDDDQAKKSGLPCGKTECWYVLSAAPGAQVGLGLRPGIHRRDVEAAIRSKTMEHLLNWIDVKAGEMIYVDAGTVHAIGPGCVLLETQQNSDTTYRLYDYGRPRELHIEKGLEAMKEVTHAGKVQARLVDGRSVLISSPRFEVDKISLIGSASFTTAGPLGETSPHCIISLHGSAQIEAQGFPALLVQKGEAAVIPAGIGRYGVRSQGVFEFVLAFLPSTVDEPEVQKVREMISALR